MSPVVRDSNYINAWILKELLCITWLGSCMDRGEASDWKGRAGTRWPLGGGMIMRCTCMIIRAGK